YRRTCQDHAVQRRSDRNLTGGGGGGTDLLGNALCPSQLGACELIIGDGAIVVLLGNRLEGEEPLRSLASTACVARLGAGFVDVGLRHSCRGTLERHEDLSGANAISRAYANRNH